MPYLYKFFNLNIIGIAFGLFFISKGNIFYRKWQKKKIN